jgi:ribosome-associated heat shock protein Hsp15
MAELTKVRLDKWLWAARFYKTRSMAKQAIEGGKVHCNGARSKSSREIEAGFTLEIRRGLDDLTVIVTALSDKRGSAPQAALLYEETLESIEKRLLQAEQRKMQRAMNPLASGRPSKQDRRQIHRFIRKNSES